jgi:hypothetical protein
MKTYSSEQLPTYQVSGQELRIHWDAKEVPVFGMDEPQTQWEQQEALCNVSDSRASLIEKIMATKYPTYGAEVAALCNGGDDAAQHEAFRAQAKSLADGWINRSNA